MAGRHSPASRLTERASARRSGHRHPEQRPDAVGDDGGREPQQRLARTHDQRRAVGEQADHGPEGEQRDDGHDQRHPEGRHALEQEVRDHRDDGADREGREAGSAGRERRAHRLPGQPDLLAHERVQGPAVVLHDAVHDERRLRRREALGHVDRPQDRRLGRRILPELGLLELDLVVQDLALAADADVLAHRHGEGAGEEAGDARDDHRAGVVGGRRAHAHHEGEVADQAVGRPEDHGPDDGGAGGVVGAGGRHELAESVSGEAEGRHVDRAAGGLVGRSAQDRATGPWRQGSTRPTRGAIRPESRMVAPCGRRDRRQNRPGRG